MIECKKEGGKEMIENNYTKRMTTQDWLRTFVILTIPLVNCLAILMWAFGEEEKADPRREYSRAALIMVGIFISLMGVVNLFS